MPMPMHAHTATHTDATPTHTSAACRRTHPKCIPHASRSPPVAKRRTDSRSRIDDGLRAVDCTCALPVATAIDAPRCCVASMAVRPCPSMNPLTPWRAPPPSMRLCHRMRGGWHGSPVRSAFWTGSCLLATRLRRKRRAQREGASAGRSAALGHWHVGGAFEQGLQACVAVFRE